MQHRQLLKADSHLQFVTTCLRRNIIPRGLQISTQPLVPKPPLQRLLNELNEQWGRIVRQASTQFLVALKYYHGRCKEELRQRLASTLDQAKLELEEENFLAIHHSVEAASSKFEQHLLKKKNRKLKAITSSTSKKRKRRRRFRRRIASTSTAQETPLDTSIVVNLSGVTLSSDEINLLSKGLTFCPVPRRVDKDQILDDLESYFRRLRLREFFADQDEAESTEQELFRPPSKWMPPKGRDATLESYVRGVRIDVQNQVKKLCRARCRDNLSSLERSALTRLRRREDIVIKPADKGSAVVVLSREDYIEKAQGLLNNADHYEKLPSDPTSTYAAEIKQFVISMFERRLITKHTKDFLIPHSPKTSRLYLLPKLHKVGIPGRPIVASNGCPTENISRFVDYHLQPLTTRIPSYVRDTTDFLNKLRELPPLPSGSLLVTLDVSSLYTNIPHDEGIKACEEALDTRIDQSLPTEDLCHLIKLILTRNAFIFNEAFYLQQSGTAMGTRMAPSYANLFMGKFEREFLRTQTALPLVWWRFIDDVFAIWTHGEQQLQTFLGELNHHHTSIKFTANWSTEEVSFLDTRVYMKNGRVETDLHTKPTDKHQYLHTKSCHPRHCKTAIPFSQALRLRRICSEQDNLVMRSQELKHYLTKRGYPEQLLDTEIHRAINTPREDSLLRGDRGRKEKRIPLVVTYHPSMKFLARTTKRHQITLRSSERLNAIFNLPPLIAFRRPKNLKDLLVHATLSWRANETVGNFRCSTNRCKTCPILKTTNVFISKATGERFTIKIHATCKTNNIVYLIECRRCGLQYVGESGQPLHKRMNGHRFDVTHGRVEESPVAAHFRSAGHSEADLSVCVIDRLWTDDVIRRKNRESRWIRTLGTLWPRGMNLRSDAL